MPLLVPDTDLSLQDQLLSYLFGLIGLLGSIWLIDIAIRAILNKQKAKTLDEQLPAWAVKVIVLLFIALPLFSIFTGTFFERPVNFIILPIIFYFVRKKTATIAFIKHDYLTAKIRSFGSLIIFFENGEYIADFDGGPCVLWFHNGKQYSYDEWSARKCVKERVFQEATEINCIADYHYTVVPDEHSASMTFYGFNGETVYYKEGELEVVARSERACFSGLEVIVCNKRAYRVVRTKKLFAWVAKLYEDDQPIATVTTRLFSLKAVFNNDLPLKERVFITLLVWLNWSPMPKLSQHLV